MHGGPETLTPHDLLHQLTGDPDATLRPSQLEAIEALVARPSPGPRRAADRVGQERRLLHRHPAAARPGRRPDAARLARCWRSCATRSTLADAAGAPRRHDQQRQPRRLGASVEAELAADASTSCSSPPSGSPTSASAPRCCPTSAERRRAARRRRGALHQRLGPRLPPRLPPHRPRPRAPAPRRPGAGHAPPPRTTAWSPTSERSSATTLVVLRGPLARDEPVARRRSSCRRRPSASRGSPSDPAAAARHRASSTASPSPTPSASPAGCVASGIDAVAYSGETDPDERPRRAREAPARERRSRSWSRPRRSAWGSTSPTSRSSSTTSRPGSPIAYYQQVGRAGRRLDQAHGILLARRRGPRHPGLLHRHGLPPARHHRSGARRAVRQARLHGAARARAARQPRAQPAPGAAQGPRGRGRGRRQRTEVPPHGPGLALRRAPDRRRHRAAPGRAAADARLRRHRRLPHGLPPAAARRSRPGRLRAMRPVPGRRPGRGQPRPRRSGAPAPLRRPSGHRASQAVALQGRRLDQDPGRPSRRGRSGPVPLG